MPDTMSNFKPAVLDIEIWKGDSWIQTYALTTNSVPISLIGATVNIQVRKGCGGTLALSLTNGDGVTIGGDDDNEITVNKLADIDKGNYKWDMQVTMQNGDVRTYLEGDFIVYDDVTK